jgi:hypothetical protein
MKRHAVVVGILSALSFGVPSILCALIFRGGLMWRR